MISLNDVIKVSPERDDLFDELGISRLKESYMMDHEISPQERFSYVSRCFGSNKEHAQRLYEYSSKHWLSYSTPILSYGRSDRDWETYENLSCGDISWSII